jgi:spermidine synthase
MTKIDSSVQHHIEQHAEQHAGNQTPSGSRFLLYLTVFASGMTTLAVELTASRLLGNVFGTSNLVWANVIGLILLYLTAGYFIGGWLADRYPSPVALYRIVAWGAFLSGLIPLLARPVLSAAAIAVFGFEAGVAFGSFIAVLVLFAIPVTLLGCVSPFAIRLGIQDVANTGKTAGRMYAVSTLGSILGTFVPVLYLIPETGTSRTFLLFAFGLLIIGLIGLGMHSRRALLQVIWMPVVLLIASLILISGPLRPPPANMTLLYEADSPYNYVQVTELTTDAGRLKAGTRLLLLNEGQGVHSVYNADQSFYGGTWDLFLAAPFFNTPPYTPDDVRRLAVVGLAAGTISTQYTDVFGEDVWIDGIEIDPNIVEAGRQFFAMNQPNLNVVVEDGRYGLSRLTRPYDVIAIDAYRVPYVPWHLTTVEFFIEVRDRLTERGVAVINVGRTVNTGSGSEDRRLVEAMTNTMLQVFPTVHTIDVPGSFNTILVATRFPSSPSNLTENRSLLPAGTPPQLVAALDTAINSLRPTVASDLVFTDDRAPVETIVNSMVVDFLLGGGVQQFQ